VILVFLAFSASSLRRTHASDEISGTISLLTIYEDSELTGDVTAPVVARPVLAFGIPIYTR